VCAGLLAGALLIVLSAQAAEPDELASTLRLLDQMQASLVRARAVAAQADPAERGRFYFDYLRASADLNTVHAGIEHYLTPSRAQPRYSGAVTGRYRRGCP
jgi:RAQPRD family integrative conjugative element protein